SMSMATSEPPFSASPSLMRSPAAAIDDLSELDNPIWNALLTEHAFLALGDGLARRYPPAIGPLSGFAGQSAASYEALRTLAGPGGIVVLFLQKPPAPPPGWTLVFGGRLDQMI